MASTKTEVVIDTVVTATGVTVATNPELVPVFYETIEWQAMVAIVAFIGVILAGVHSYFGIKRQKLAIAILEKENQK